MFAVFATCVHAAEPAFPALSGRVVDEAGLFSQAERDEIATTLRELEAKSSDQIVVVTVKSLQGYDIADYGVRLARAWKIGQGGTNNGVLLIVAPNDRKTRIEVGRGLEPLMTDTMSKIVIDNALLPAFRRGDFVGGVKAAVRDIRDVLLGDAEAVKRRAQARDNRSEEVDWFTVALVVFWIAIALFVVYAHIRAASQPQPGPQQASVRRRNRHREADPGPVIVPGDWGGSGGWRGGSPDPDSGWGGGGGDFGGGGSSGSW